VTTEITNNIGRVTFSNPPVNPLNRAVCSGLVAAISGADRQAQALPLSNLHDKKETSGQQ
jgi:enoyl-CoA hydratase/carnithine racemase